VEYQRGEVLFQQKRYADAEREFRADLSREPDHAMGHAMLALALAAQGKFRDGEAEARLAIAIDPQLAFGFYVLAVCLHDLQQYDAARSMILEAIRLDSGDPRHFSLLALIEFQRKDWKAAIAAADRGLEIDPQCANCLVRRAQAEAQMGDSRGAMLDAEAALRQDPEAPLTHSTLGWALICNSRPHEAVSEFLEALRLDPHFAPARLGLIRSLKARYFPYRIMMESTMALGKIPKPARIALAVGMYGLIKLYSSSSAIGHDNPLLGTVCVIYLLFLCAAWLADPLFNVLLRFHPLGKHAMSTGQRIGANQLITLAGVILGIALAAQLANWTARTVAVGAVLLLLPIVSLLSRPPGRQRRTHAIILIVIICLGIMALVFRVLKADDKGVWFALQVLMMILYVGLCLTSGAIRHPKEA
jgi:tetratricopeptide (TPR) repeat protein